MALKKKVKIIKQPYEPHVSSDAYREYSYKQVMEQLKKNDSRTNRK